MLDIHEDFERHATRKPSRAAAILKRVLSEWRVIFSYPSAGTRIKFGEVIACIDGGFYLSHACRLTQQQPAGLDMGAICQKREQLAFVLEDELPTRLHFVLKYLQGQSCYL